MGCDWRCNHRGVVLCVTDLQVARLDFAGVSGAMEDRENSEGPVERVSDRRLNAIQKDLQNQIVELRAELRSFRLTVYCALLVFVVAVLAADGQWSALAIFVACAALYSAYWWVCGTSERAGRDTP